MKRLEFVVHKMNDLADKKEFTKDDQHTLKSLAMILKHGIMVRDLNDVGEDINTEPSRISYLKSLAEIKQEYQI